MKPDIKYITHDLIFKIHDTIHIIHHTIYIIHYLIYKIQNTIYMYNIYNQESTNTHTHGIFSWSKPPNLEQYLVNVKEIIRSFKNQI